LGEFGLVAYILFVGFEVFVKDLLASFCDGSMVGYQLLRYF
jgi:hypothetical protein